MRFRRKLTIRGRISIKKSTIKTFSLNGRSVYPLWNFQCESMTLARYQNQAVRLVWISQDIVTVFSGKMDFESVWQHDEKIPLEDVDQSTILKWMNGVSLLFILSNDCSGLPENEDYAGNFGQCHRFLNRLILDITNKKIPGRCDACLEIFLCIVFLCKPRFYSLIFIFLSTCLITFCSLGV